MTLHVTINLSEKKVAELEAQARAAHMPTDRYVNEIVDRALQGNSSLGPVDRGEQGARKPKKSAYGLLAKYGPGPTEAEIDENRREMFRGFGELTP